MIFIVGFFAKLSQKPGTPLWLVYVFKSITLLLLLYVIYFVVASFFGTQISAIATGILGAALVVVLIINYKKFMQKKKDALKEVDDIGNGG